MTSGVYIRTEKHKEISRKGGLNSPTKYIKGHSLGFKKGNIPWNKGNKPVIKIKIKKVKKLYPPKTGMKRGSKELKEYLSLKLRGRNIGEKGSNWQGGKTKLNRIIRDRFEYHQWVSFVMTRDNWTCQTCNKRGCYLEVHHIKAFSLIIKDNNIHTIEEALNCKELWDITNGLTLCKECHKQTENYLFHCLKKDMPVGGL